MHRASRGGEACWQPVKYERSFEALRRRHLRLTHRKKGGPRVKDEEGDSQGGTMCGSPGTTLRRLKPPIPKPAPAPPKPQRQSSKPAGRIVHRPSFSDVVLDVLRRRSDAGMKEEPWSDEQLPDTRTGGAPFGRSRYRQLMLMYEALDVEGGLRCSDLRDVLDECDDREASAAVLSKLSRERGSDGPVSFWELLRVLHPTTRNYHITAAKRKWGEPIAVNSSRYSQSFREPWQAGYTDQQLADLKDVFDYFYEFHDDNGNGSSTRCVIPRRSSWARVKEAAHAPQWLQMALTAAERKRSLQEPVLTKSKVMRMNPPDYFGVRPIPVSELMEMISEADTDQDGCLAFSEFCQLMRDPLSGQGPSVRGVYHKLPHGGSLQSLLQSPPLHPVDPPLPRGGSGAQL
eukprot:Sspe_Gene.101317::Locus_75909_Transcript_1_1_Confidence_1.000_Length_1653::g.101317::m.101317